MRTVWLIVPCMAAAGFAAGYLGKHEPTGRSPQSSQLSSPALRNSGSVRGAASSDERSGGREGEQQDRQAMLAQALSHPSRLHRYHDLVEMVDRLDAADFPRVLTLLESRHKEADGVEARVLYAAWAAKAPLAALEHALTIPKEWPRHAALVTIIGAWAQHDEKSVLAWFATQPVELQRSGLQSLAEAQIERGFGDPGATIKAWLAVQSGKPMGSWAVAPMFEKLAARDPSSAAREALNIADGEQRESAMRGVLRAWAEKDAHAAMAWFHQIEIADPVHHIFLVEDFASRLVKKDQKLAVEFAQSQPPGERRSRAIGTVAAHLYARDPSAAVALAAAVRPEETMALNRGFYDEWVSEDPKAALADYARRLDALDPASPIRKSLEGFFENNYTTGEAYSRDPRPIAEYLSTEREPKRQAILTEVAAAWAAADLAKARQWAETLPKGSAREHAVAGIASGWAQHAASEAAAWIESLPQGTMRNKAVEGYAGGVFSKDPASALASLRTIPNPQERLARLRTAWARWKNYPGEEAVRWRDTSPELTNAERRALATAAP
ncbi:MAG: hypothetical protein M3463_17295 [Verrucomicrobiota bacterium]|nr:hypothetical protein [Verrucomicrobiota bacterium]